MQLRGVWRVGVNRFACQHAEKADKSFNRKTGSSLSFSVVVFSCFLDVFQ